MPSLAPILEIDCKSDYVKCDSGTDDADDDAGRERSADYNPQGRSEMDPIDTTVTIADWLSDSYLRSVVITCIMTGFALGFLLGKYAFGFLRWYIEWRREREPEKEAARRRAEKESAMQAFLKERIQLGLEFNGIAMIARSGRPYCPRCFERHHISGLVRHPQGTTMYCPDCDFYFSAGLDHNGM